MAVKQKELVKLAHAKKDYSKLADEIDELREQKQKFLVQKAEQEGYKKRVNDLITFLEKMNLEEFCEYDEAMVRKYIEKIKVYDEKFLVTFKAGIDIEVER